MAKTDRELIKTQQAGSFDAIPLATPVASLASLHSHSRDYTKVGTENAATNVAATLMFSVRRKSKVGGITYLTGTNVAADNTNSVYFTVSKMTAGGTAVVVASFNTHAGAQGAITANVPAAFSVVQNSDAILASGDSLHYTITKASSGTAVAIGTITTDLESV